MKGIVLAGGTGSRLYPLTKITNKHLLPVGRYPMIFFPIAKLAMAGIADIMVITGKLHMGDVVNLLGSGAELGLEFTFRVQDEPEGIAQALALAEGFVDNDLCTVILGDNIFEDDITPYVKSFEKQGEGAKILIKEVPDPRRYGVVEISGDRVVGIEEKPEQPKSSFCVTGIYMYDPEVFGIIRGLKPSKRGELEITDVNNAYIARGKLTYEVLKGWWTDAGTFPSLVLANSLTSNCVLPLFEQTASFKAALAD